MSGEEIQGHFDSLRRDPFKFELVKLLQNSPSPKAIKKFADKSPDRYWQAVVQAARLGGFSDKLEVDVKFKPLSSLADSELRNMLEDLNHKLDHVVKNTEDNKAIEASKVIEPENALILYEDKQ